MPKRSERELRKVIKSFYVNAYMKSLTMETFIELSHKLYPKIPRAELECIWIAFEIATDNR